jgi:DNA-binding transcriptional LysR family regulator
MPILQESLPGLRAFILSVDAGSFTAAARVLGSTPSAVSKSVAKLERTLGIRLLQRTTRAIHPTPEGQALHKQGASILTDLDELEELVTAKSVPRGLLRVSAPLDLGRHWLVPRVSAFLARYPEIECVLSLTDRFVDLVDERIDVALRMGDVGDGRLVRKRLGMTSAMLCATSGYLKSRGTPQSPTALADHNCLAYACSGRRIPWVFEGPAGRFELAPKGTLASDNNDALIAIALAGIGITRIPSFMGEPHIRAGRLRRVLPRETTPGLAAYAAYPEQHHLPMRARVFLDFLASEFRQTPP